MAENQSAAPVCRQWWAAWNNGDESAKRKILAEDLVFRFNSAPEIRGREAFLTGESWPSTVMITLLAELYNGDRGVHFYEARNGNSTLRVSEHFIVCEGHISEIDFITDTASYPTFIEGEPSTTSTTEDASASRAGNEP